MALKLCTLDWRNDITTVRKRSPDLWSVSNRQLAHPDPNNSHVPALVTWAWPSVIGDDGGAGPWNANPETPLGVWTQMAVANNWHLFDPDEEPGSGVGTARLIFGSGLFGFFAVDLRIPECADAFADMFCDWPGFAGWIGGCHWDYGTDPISLGAESFSDYIGAVATAFIEEYQEGMGRAYMRIRERKGADFPIVIQRDHQLTAGDPRLAPLLAGDGGYFHEQRIGLFQPFQDSFATVQAWLLAHNALIGNHAPYHIIEYGGAGQDIPGRPNSTLDSDLSGKVAEYDAGLIQTRDDYFTYHKNLCINTGAYLSYNRDQNATFAGHRANPGKFRRRRRIYPSSTGLVYSQWSPGAEGYRNVSDGLTTTGLSTGTDARRHHMGIVLPTLETGCEILDVSIGGVFSQQGGTLCESKLAWGDGTNVLSGRDHRASSTPVTFYEENVPHPADDTDWQGGGVVEIGVLSTRFTGGATGFFSEVYADVDYESLSDEDGGSLPPPHHGQGRPQDKQKIIQKLSPPISEELFNKMQEPCPMCGSAVTRWTEGDRPYMYQSFREFRGTCSNGTCKQEITIFG